MRLLFLNHNVRGRGTYLRAFQFARQLVARGHQVTLFTTSEAARWVITSHDVDGVEVIEAPDLLIGRGRTGWDPWNAFRRSLRLRHQSFDIIHAFDSRPVVVHPALIVQRWTGAPLFMDWADWWGRGGWIEDRSGWMVRTLFGPIETWYEERFRCAAAGTTTISTALAQRAVALGVPATTVLQLPNGCDVQSVLPGSRAAARTRLGIAAEAPLLVHVGLLTVGDFALLTDAFARVRSRLPEARLVLVGRTAIRVTGTEGVTVTGAVENGTMADWLTAADACVIPCRDTIGNRGRWPSKVNDYLSAGRAVVMPRVGDVGHVVDRAGAGWLSADNAEEFGAAMRAALSSREEADEKGSRARRLAETSLAWPLLAERLEQFYQRSSAEVAAPLPLMTL
jgi:glycosyltransferase involved in cell wall biosynthesis